MLANFVESGRLNESAHFRYAHESDLLRLVVLSRHGGIYLDTDLLLLRPLDDVVLSNPVLGVEYFNDPMRESKTFGGIRLNNAFMGFPHPGNPFLDWVMTRVDASYNPKEWAAIGPDLITEGYKAQAEEVQDAVRLFRARARSRPEDVEALEEGARAEVQAAVAEAEAAVLRERRLARPEYEYAAAYYTLTARSAAVLEARTALRRSVGRFFVTKSSLLGIMRASHERRASQAQEHLASAWERGLITSPQQVQEMFMAPAFQATLSSDLEKFFEEETGMSASELAALSRSPRFLEVRVGAHGWNRLWGGLRHTCLTPPLTQCS